MKTRIQLLAPEVGTEGSGTASSTVTPSAPEGGADTNSNGGGSTDKLKDPKHNPWADETVRNTSAGEVVVKPVVKPTPVVTPQAPATPVVPQAQTPTPATPVTSTAPAQTGQSLDPKALAREFAQEMRTLTKPAEQPVQPMSDEAFDAHFGVPQVTAETFTAMFGFAPDKPEQVAALAQTLRGYNVATLRMAKQMFDTQVSSLREELTRTFSPALEATNAQVEAKVQDEFFKTYPGLRDQIPLLTEIRELAEAQVKSGKLSFKTPADVINFVAEKASKLLGRPVESFKTSASSGGGQVTTPQQPAAASRQMTTATTGGRTGGAGSATTTKPKSTAESLFGRNDD